MEFWAKRLVFALFFCMLYLSGMSRSLREVVLSTGVEEVSLQGDYMEIAEDSLANWTIDSVTAPAFEGFRVNTASYRYVQNHHSIYWIHFKISNEATPRQKWIFEALSLHTHHLQLYFRDEDGSFYLQEAGARLPFDIRIYKVKNLTFDLPLRSGKTYDVYLRVASQNDAGFEYKIRSQQYFTWYATHEYWWLGIYYGLLGFLILYNLLLFVSSPDKIYLLYSFYLAGCCLVSFSEDGLFFEFLWPSFPLLNTWIDEYCELFFLLGFLGYATSFVSLHTRYRKLWIALCMVVACYIGTQLFGQKTAQVTYLYFYWVPFVVVYTMVVHTYLKGYKAARLLVVGFTLVLLSILMSRLRWYGFIDANIFTVYSFNFAVVMEAFVFSYAMAERYRFLKQEKETAQQTLIAQLEANKQLQTKVNRELEQQVAVRTQELQGEKEKLDKANTQLKALTEELNRMNSQLDIHNWELQKTLKEETRSRIVSEKVSYEEFMQIFPTDYVCLEYLSQLKWEEGFACKKCVNTKFSVSKEEPLARRCSKCGYTESAKAHTIFQSVKFPLPKAFYLVYFEVVAPGSTTLDALSALLDLRRNTCWAFRKKIQQRKEDLKHKNKANLTGNWEILILD
jgi:ribosomal protein L37E